MSLKTDAFSDDLSYSRFVHRYFPGVYRWCTENCADRDRASIAAQRMILELYRLEQGAI